MTPRQRGQKHTPHDQAAIVELNAGGRLLAGLTRRRPLLDQAPDQPTPPPPNERPDQL